MYTREQLFEHLRDHTKVLKEERLRHAFQKVDRADFVLDDFKIEAYEDYPLPIGHGQTISQPTTVAFMLEKLGAKPGDKVLDIGSGSGWSTALLAELVGEEGKVFGVELIPELVAFGQKNLRKYKYKHVQIGQAEELGILSEGLFDRILVSASAKELQQVLVDQLASGGILVMPVNNTIVVVHKKSGKEIDVDEFPGFVFVPLIQ